MRATVAIVELVRGMTGRAPSQATVNDLLVPYGTGGTTAVFETLITSPAYRTRVLA